MTKRRAFISVWNKDGIAETAKILSETYGYEIVSTGGTYDLLEKSDVKVIEISEITGFTELLGGKVKSLHPKIHAGILADRTSEKEMKEIQENGIDPFDIVIVNLYPFAKAKESVEEDKELIKFIDIGGVALLRAGAKNYSSVTVISAPEQYKKFLENLEQNNGTTSLEFRQNTALEAFFMTSSYDGVIFSEFEKRFPVNTKEKNEILGLNVEKIQDLRYGENPHQQAALYGLPEMLDFELLNGKELSFNNIVDMASAMNIISEFYDVPAVCIIKHNNPCGVALGEDITEAYTKAFDCDPISAFGGIIGFSQTVTREIAEAAKQVFLEVLIAPDFDPEALELLKAKKNLRLVKLKTSLKEFKAFKQVDLKVTPFGILAQDMDKEDLNKDTFEVVTKAKPSDEQVEDMIFAWKVAKHVKSNAIVVAKNKKTLGIGMGQTSRIASVEIALKQACDEAKDAVIASDGFFPAVDNIQAAAQSRIVAIIQPGGSIKDPDVIAEADKYNIAVITTGIRHFKH